MGKLGRSHIPAGNFESAKWIYTKPEYAPQSIKNTTRHIIVPYILGKISLEIQAAY